MTQLRQDYIKGRLYNSITHGIVEYKGIDVYYGQASMKFYSLKHGMQYWLPEALHHHFEEEKEQSKMPEQEESDFEEIIKQRDYWESKATELAQDIGEALGFEVGEHSNLNCPVQNAIDQVYHLKDKLKIN